MDEDGVNYPPPPPAGQQSQFPYGPPTICASGHAMPPGASFCGVCGQPVSHSTPAAFGVPPVQTHNRRNWIIAGVAGVVLIAAIGIVLVTSGSSSSPPRATRAQLTTSQRAITRCTIAVAAGVDKIQTGGSGESQLLASRLGSASLINVFIQRANNYLDTALQRVHPRQAALQQTVREIEYLCSGPIEYLASGERKGTISVATAHSDLREYLVGAAAAVVATGGLVAAVSYFSSVSGFSGVSGISDVSGFTGLTGDSGFSAPSGTSDSSPGGFTGVTGSSGLSGVTGGGVSGFSGGGGVVGNT